MPNLSLFLQNWKNNGNESLQNISALQYTFMSHRPFKTGYIHNIHWYKGPEIKKIAKKRPQKDQKMPNLSLFVAKFEKVMETSLCKT